MSFQCPTHRDDAKDRSVFWFIHPDEWQGPGGGGTKWRYDYDGHSFADITVWQVLPHPEEAIRGMHWWGYLLRGSLYLSEGSGTGG